jgi:hypothetical protein
VFAEDFPVLNYIDSVNNEMQLPSYPLLKWTLNLDLNMVTERVVMSFGLCNYFMHFRRRIPKS